MYGYQLTSSLPKKGVLIMNVRKRSGGPVSAGLVTNLPWFFRTYSASQILDNSEKWQEISIAFEQYPETTFKEKEWAFLGIRGNDAETQVQVKDMRIIWQQQEPSGDAL